TPVLLVLVLPVALVKEASAHGEKLAALEAVAARLRDFSRKQDGAVIQNMVLSARERLGKVLQRLAERGATLEEARKRSKQFSESRQLLLDWMDEAEQSLEVPPDTTTSQEELKSQLAEHKAFQKVLRSKRPVLEATLRSGRVLREGARLDQDLQPLEELLRDLKEHWDALCSRTAERQHWLEEKLLLSGKFSEALQALLDWLYRAEPQLSEDAPVGGDRDLVSDLMDKHKVFQKELGKRAGCVRALMRSVRDPARGNSPWLQRQLEELSTRWDLVCRLSLGRQARLEAALRQVRDTAQLLEWMAAAEEALALRDMEPLPQEAEPLQELSAQHAVRPVTCCVCAPAGLNPTEGCRHTRLWLCMQQCCCSSFHMSQPSPWALHQELQMQEGAVGLLCAHSITLCPAALQQWWDVLLWPVGAQCALPQVFMEELNRKQPDVERVTKSCKQKLAAELAPPVTRRLATRKDPPCPQSPLTAQVLQRWQQLWLLALDRQYRIETALQRLRELEEFAHFDFGVWRKRYMHWIGQMKSRVLDVFRGIDRDQDGRISQREFIESVLSSSECLGIPQDPPRHLGSNGAMLVEMGMDGVCLWHPAQAGGDGLEQPEEKVLVYSMRRSSP
uniref:EF-hand domain-containing protein n=1 Tax=Strigops habroptila TaxID=2489341 RepID=A0A672TH14_STRHB